jgi:ELWxxDGT repeat protein
MSTNLDVAVISPWKAELVKDIVPGFFDLSASNLINFNNTLYFESDQTQSYYSSYYAAKEQLWKTDGTEAGTTLIKDLGLFENQAFSSEVNNDILYFEVLVQDPNTNFSSLQLWKTDGTDTGTQLIKDWGSSLTINSFIPLDNSLYFTTGNYWNDTQLWKTDGTEAGTILVKDFGNDISDITEVNNSLYLDVSQYDSMTGTSTAQLWKTDSTGTEVELIKDFGNLTFGTAYEDSKISVNDSLYFEITQSYNYYSPTPPLSQLWKSDGTNTGTTIVKDFGSSKDINNFWDDLNNTFYFSVSIPNTEDYYNTTYELWKSDGTDGGTTLVQDFGKSSLDYLTTVNNTLYFTVNSIDSLTNINNRELWKVDSNGNISLVKNLGNFSIQDWEVIDNTLYFQALKTDSDTYTSTAQLWKTDGTDIGTILVKEFPNSNWVSSYNSAGLEVINNTLYFPLSDLNYGTELWMSNGTETGTMMVADINPGKASSNASIPVDVNGILYLTADDGIHGNELWKLTPTGSNPISQEGLRSNAKALAMSHLNSMSELISTAYPAPTFSNLLETPSNF